MPKVKSSSQEIQNQFDRPPLREGLFDKLKSGFVSIAGFYGYERIFTPVLENPRSFQPLVREGLMFETPPIFCKTRNGEEIVLKPSGALSVLRAYFTHKMQDLPHPVKLLFDTQVFFLPSILSKNASSNPASLLGRPECGVVIIGEDGPVAEAQIIQLIWKGLNEGGVRLDGFAFRINATGCSECRSAFRQPFVSYLRNRSVRLCKGCKIHLKRQPTRILVCEEEKCRIVVNFSPQVLDFLCDACKKHLTGLLEFLDEMDIPYFLDPKFFRDGSPFNLVIFELVNPHTQNARSILSVGVKNLSASSAVASESEKSGQAVANIGQPIAGPGKGLVFAEGGRLSRAAELMGGKKTDIVSGAIFLEALESFARGFVDADARRPKVFFAHLGELAKRKSMKIIEELRAAGIETQESLGRDSIKSQLKVAERIDAGVALLLGQKEALDGTIIVRETGLGVQETIPQERLVEFLRKKLKK